MSDLENECLQALKEVLIKYNAAIGFSCADGSDLHAVYDEAIIIDINNKEIFRENGYYLEANDIKL